MSKQKPHSDQSGRAQRRREEQEVARAQRTVARAPAQGMQLSVEKALAKIGVLTLERDALQQQVAQLVEALKSQSAPVEEEMEIDADGNIVPKEEEEKDEEVDQS